MADSNLIAGTGTSDGTQRCCSCHQLRPITEFRRRYANREDRQSNCRVCHNADMRARKQREIQQRPHQFALEVNRSCSDTLAMITLTATMIRRLGGIDKFVELWHDAMKQAECDGKHYLVSRSLLAVLNLTKACNSIHQHRSTPAELSDEDVQRQLEQAATRVIVENPEIALHAARQLGWQVIPPPEEPADSQTRTSA